MENELATLPVQRTYSATVDSVDAGARTIVATINTDAVDRYKTVISPDGISLEAYRKNPVVLWEHGKDPVRGSLPIGRNLWIKQVGRTLRAKTLFGKDEYSRSLFDMYKDETLRGWSINVLPDPRHSSPPTKAELHARSDLLECRMVYRKGELAEYSAVVVPGNAETLSLLQERGIWVPAQEPAKPEKLAAEAAPRVPGVQRDGDTFVVIDDNGREAFRAPSLELAEICLRAMQDPTKNFEHIHFDLLNGVRREQRRLREDVLAMLDLVVSGKV